MFLDVLLEAGVDEILDRLDPLDVLGGGAPVLHEDLVGVEFRALPRLGDVRDGHGHAHVGSLERHEGERLHRLRERLVVVELVGSATLRLLANLHHELAHGEEEVLERPDVGLLARGDGGDDHRLSLERLGEERGRVRHLGAEGRGEIRDFLQRTGDQGVERRHRGWRRARGRRRGGGRRRAGGGRGDPRLRLQPGRDRLEPRDECFHRARRFVRRVPTRGPEKKDDEQINDQPGSWHPLSTRDAPRAIPRL